MPRTITPATSLDNLRKEAKRWLKALRAGDPDARARFANALSAFALASPTLRDVQHALAHEYGHASWLALKQALDKPVTSDSSAARPMLTAEEYDRLAHDFVLAFDARDEAALGRLNAH